MNSGAGGNGGGRKFKRKLTPFLAHEMLYDYATDQLDVERRSAVEEFLETDQEGRTILANLRSALGYVDRLGRAEVDSSVLEHLKDAESPVSLGKKYSSWNEWPEPLRWSLSAIAISCVVAAFVAFVPWNLLGGFFKKKPADTVQIAQIQHPAVADVETAEEPVGSGDAAPDDESSGDEEMGADEGGAPSAQIAKEEKPTPAAAQAKAAPAAKAVADGLSAAPSALAMNAKAPSALSASMPPSATYPIGQHSASTATKVAAVAPPVATPVPTPAKSASTPPPAAASSEEAAADEEPPQEKAKGFVYRAFMNLSNLEEVAPQITDAIRGLGGEKAGEVELGWKRGSGRYYHFALPEENEKKLLDKLQAYGPVRISKDPHPRVMPQGKVRFILWVEAAP